MAKLTITIDSEEFDNIVQQLGLEVNVQEEKILELIKQNINLENIISKQIRSMFITEGIDYSGRKYTYLSSEIAEIIKNSVKPKIESEVSDYIRTQHVITSKIINEEVKKRIEEGITNGIKYYAEKVSKKIA